eukprot:GDKJ01058221.1.p1 GENE.GDKJ01058221.1~~GDKJ01058221.1.p1  ORF type:complete len:201 (-),score=35.74 GDKJ01058221.1:18-620(-)
MGEFYRGVAVKDSVGIRDPDDYLLKGNSIDKKCIQTIDFERIRVNVFRPWIKRRVQEILGRSDELLSEMVFARLEKGDADPYAMYLQIIGFMDNDKSKTSILVNDVFSLLLEAQIRPEGIPQVLIDEKKKELEQRKRSENEMEKVLAGRNAPVRVQTILEQDGPKLKFPLHAPSLLAMGDDEIEKARANQLLVSLKNRSM